VPKDFKVSQLADIYGGLLTEKQLNVIKDYFDYDMSLSEAGEKYGITRQAVHDFISKSKEALLNYETKLNVLKAVEYLDGITDEAFKIHAENIKRILSGE